MARYTGPKHKLCRRLGECIWGNTNCPSAKRPYPPGQHGQNMRRKRSVYGNQLLQKQKIRVHYGLIEKQMRTTFQQAKNMGGVTDNNLMMLLESRLDSVVYRLGFGNSMRAARQLVSHGHIQVNGKSVNIPSYRVQVDDVVSVREKSRKIPTLLHGVENPPPIPEYLEREANSFEGKMIATPNLQTVPFQPDTQSVIGFYSR